MIHCKTCDLALLDEMIIAIHVVAGHKLSYPQPKEQPIEIEMYLRTKLNELDNKLDRNHHVIQALERKVTTMDADVQALTAEVARQSTITASVLAFLQTINTGGLSANDRTALEAAIATLTGNDDTLNAAVPPPPAAPAK